MNKSLIAAVALSVICVLLLAGCGAASEPVSEPEAVHQHTTDFGVCEICGDFQDMLRCQQILNKLEGTATKYDAHWASFSNQWEKTYCHEEITSVQEAYDFCKREAARFQLILDDFSAVAELCGDCKEFQPIKEALEKFVAVFPTLSPEVSAQSLNSFIDGMRSMPLYLIDIGTACKDTASKLSLVDGVYDDEGHKIN